MTRGRTWESVSELGTSDFHALARSGDVLVAPLYGQAQILLSRDDGKTFEPRVAPMALVDLAVDPGDPRRWAATSESGIFVSVDEGRTWRQRDPTPNVRLAWRDSDELYRIDPGGPVKVELRRRRDLEGPRQHGRRAAGADRRRRRARCTPPRWTARSRSPRTAASPGPRSSRRSGQQRAAPRRARERAGGAGRARDGERGARAVRLGERPRERGAERRGRRRCRSRARCRPP